jgi:FXSXX-COOH protein
MTVSYQQSEPAGEFTDNLVDLGDIPLDDLGALPLNAFGSSLKRLMAEIRDPQDVVAGWNSAM